MRFSFILPQGASLSTWTLPLSVIQFDVVILEAVHTTISISEKWDRH
jgi:hypothetical protein